MVIQEIVQIKTKGFTDIIDITSKVNNFIAKNKVTKGNLCVFVKGSTASVSTIEYEPGLKKDIPEILDKYISYESDYKHHATWGCNNGAAHVRATLMGPSRSFPVMDGKIPLGTWQQIVLIDFDTTERSREVYLSFNGE